jgi:hypothetical protein
MNRKKCRDKSTPPERSGHLYEHEKQQHHTGRVQQHVREAVAAGVPPVQLTIEHVRKPGERMPIIGVIACERPCHPLKREAADDLRIIVNIIRVIVVHEVVTQRLAKNQPGNYRQEDTSPDDLH